MIKEVAVDPEAIGTWDRFRLVVERFGVEHGRVISRFPKRWPELVKQAVRAERSFLNKQRILDKLAALERGRGHALLSFERPYEGGDPWRVNAVRENCREPFHRIVVAAGSAPGCICVDDLDEDALQTENQVTVPRTAAALAEAMRPMLACCQELTLVDPYVRMDDERSWRTVAALITAAATGRPLRRCDVHTSCGRPEMRFANFAHLARRNVAPLLPAGLTVTFVRWREREGGERLHARYIFTDIGGIQVEGGLDEGPRGQTTDLILLAAVLWEERRKQYCLSNDTFESADLTQEGVMATVEVTGTGPAGGR